MLPLFIHAGGNMAQCDFVMRDPRLDLDNLMYSELGMLINSIYAQHSKREYCK